MYRSVFNLLAFLVLVSCADIPRDNLLDPKNPDGFSKSIILAEAFVNTSSTIPGNYSQWAMQGLEQAVNLSEGKVLVAEYHRDVQTYDDTLNTEQTNLRFSQLHKQYTINQDAMGVPDIFINGAANRVRGSSGTQTTKEQVTNIIAPLLTEKNFFRIEAEIEQGFGSELVITCTVAALGNTAANNLNLRLIFLKDYGAGMKNVVVDLINKEPLPDLDQGAVVEKTIRYSALTEVPDRVLIAIVDASGTQVYQTQLEAI